MNYIFRFKNAIKYIVIIVFFLLSLFFVSSQVAHAQVCTISSVVGTCKGATGTCPTGTMPAAKFSSLCFTATGNSICCVVDPNATPTTPAVPTAPTTPPVITPTAPAPQPYALTVFTGGGGGLVPCGGGPDNPCTFQHLLEMVEIIIYYILAYVMIPFFAVMCLYTGYVLIVSAGNVSKIAQAKSALGTLFMGLLIALAAWLIIQGLMLGLGIKPAFSLLEP